MSADRTPTEATHPFRQDWCRCQHLGMDHVLSVGAAGALLGACRLCVDPDQCQQFEAVPA